MELFRKITTPSAYFKKNIAGKLNLLFLLTLCASLLNSCSFSDERKEVSLALTKDGKTYLFNKTGSIMNKFKNPNIPANFGKNKIPVITVKIKIVEKDDELFVEPGHLENIVNLISGNYIITEQEEKSFDGYVSQNEYDVYDKKYGTESTEEIGQMLSTVNIYIADTAHTKEFHILWQRSPNKKPLENCEKMSLWVDKSYKPGERTVTKEDHILINLNKIVEFYNSNVTLNYVKEDKVLYIVVN